jgi:hypothetical protein
MAPNLESTNSLLKRKNSKGWEGGLNELCIHSDFLLDVLGVPKANIRVNIILCA